jgi:uncharacterized OsmC-like protein
MPVYENFSIVKVKIILLHNFDEEEIKKQVEYALNAACTMLEGEKVDVTYKMELE